MGNEMVIVVLVSVEQHGDNGNETTQTELIDF